MTRKKTAAVSGLGVDLAEVRRVRRLAANPKFLARVFTPVELAYAGRGRNRFERLAARFAVKEAVIKALADTSIPLKDIEVENTAGGSPKVRVRGRSCALLVSITHTASHAFAAVIAFR
ncbi:MAG: holo-ACP synthase [Elusimicrobia bacterium]|nr:holo-ACP synthase [Elusimicrobiota bacterium]